MVSVNLIFHVVSGLTFVVLIWYLLRQQAQLSFLRTLTGSLTLQNPKVVVDWPHLFLKKMSDGLGLGFELKGKESPSAQRIDVKTWAEAHLRLGFESLEWDEGVLRIKIRRNEELASWGSRLESSLQGKIKIEWIVPRHP